MHSFALFSITAFAALTAALPQAFNAVHEDVGTLAPRDISWDGSCGDWSGMTCREGFCCGATGWCGNSIWHCGAGCQTGFGICDDDPLPGGEPTSSSAAAPITSAYPTLPSSSFIPEPSTSTTAEAASSTSAEATSSTAQQTSTSTTAEVASSTTVEVSSTSVQETSAPPSTTEVSETITSSSTTSVFTPEPTTSSTSVEETITSSSSTPAPEPTTSSSTTEVFTPEPTTSSTSVEETTTSSSTPAPEPTTSSSTTSVFTPEPTTSSTSSIEESTTSTTSSTQAPTTEAPTTTSTSSTAAPTTSTSTTTTSAAPAETSTNVGTDSYTVYTGTGSLADGWPAMSSWVDFSSMWTANLPILQISCAQFGQADNSAQENSDLRSAILQISSDSGVDARFILAVTMQESKGCVRAPTTFYSHANPGLMQSHSGDGTCNSLAGVVQNPCPASEITLMISDGTEGTAAGDGLVQTLQQANAEGAAQYYRAARIYNSGSIAASGLLEDGVATHCYASDIANRLTGWVTAASTCNL